MEGERCPGTPAPTVRAGTPGSSLGSGGARDCQEKASRYGSGRVKFPMGCCDALRIAGGTGSRWGDEQHQAVGLRASPAAFRGAASIPSRFRGASPASLARRSGICPFTPPEQGGEQPRHRVRQGCGQAVGQKSFPAERGSPSSAFVTLASLPGFSLLPRIAPFPVLFSVCFLSPPSSARP